MVTVEATSGTGDREMTATQTITVTVTDADEKSAKPDKPTLAKVTGSSTSLTATWTKPGLNGGPDIAGYKLEYKLSTETSWTAFTHTGSGLTTTITGLTADTSYQVRVRAENGETDSDWSDASDAVSTNAETVTPTCTLNTGDLWCGVVTVGAITATQDGFFQMTGGLSDTTFSVGTHSYTIDAVSVDDSTVSSAGFLVFSLTSALTAAERDKLVLHVGSNTFAFSAAGYGASTHNYSWIGTSLDWLSTSTVTLRLRAPNNAPVFADASVTREVAENSAVGTDVGAVVTATDADSGDTLEYSLDGTDAASFDIDDSSGQIQTVSGVDYNHEAAQNSYSVTVKASDGLASDTIAVTIDVTDVNEKSAKPDKPTLAKVTGSSTSLTATWTKPDLDGGPEITGYAVQYKVNTATTWEDFAHSDTAVTTTVTGLTADTSYQVQVRAKNGETDSDWSDASDAVKTNAEMSTPSCTLNTGDLWCGAVTVALHTVDGSSIGYGFADASVSTNTSDTGALSNKNFTVTTGTIPYTIDGALVGVTFVVFSLTSDLTAADKEKLVLHVDGSSGSFAFSDATGPDTGHSYQWPPSGLSWSSETSVTLRLRLAPEEPGKPTNLMAEADGGTRITLSWDAPADDGGSAITGYRIEVSDDAGSNWDDLVDDTGDDDTSYIHEGLSPGDTRHYRVSAINAEGASVASDVADATTAAAPTCTLNPGDLWCGVVTVERFPHPPLDLDGFGSGEGDLSDTDFTYGSNSYTIDLAANERNNGLLVFSLTSALTAEDRAALELHVDGNASFAFSAAIYNSSAHNYTWTGTGLDWFDTSTVTLRLRAATETDATLRALSVTHPGGTVALRPAFAPGTTEYRASVANPVDEVTVAATATVADAMVRYLDADGTAIPDTDTGTPGREVALEVGATVVEVTVTAEDGTTMRTYRVTVTRRAVDAPGVEGEFRLTETEPYADEDNDRHGGTAGRVEVSHAGAWGTVCRDGIRDSKKDTTFSTFDYDVNGDVILDADGNPQQFDKVNEAAALICRAMDYDDGEYYMKYSKFRPGQAEADHQVADYVPPGSTYSGAATPIWLDDLRCVAGESALGTDPLPGAMSHCSYAGWGLHNGTHKEDAVVRCWNNDSGVAGLKSLQGRFVSPPERHDGTNRIKVRVAFSEPVEESPEKVGAHGVEVEGGDVTSVSPVGGDAPDGAGTRSVGGRNAGRDDREVVWEFEIEPDSDGDLTVTLEAGRPCDEPGAICTADGRALFEGISTTVEGPDTGPPPLTASFENMPAAHDGAGAFTFRVAFSENIGISYRSLREDAFTVTGGRVTRGKRVDDRRDLFEMTVEPEGEDEVTVTLPAGRECGVSGAICTKGETRRPLTNAPTATVAGPAVASGPAGLTARVARVPLEHNGRMAFTLRIAFSETIRMSGRRLRGDVVSVAGGRATKARPVKGRKDLWKLKVRPDSRADVTVTLAAGAACDSSGAVCTADGRALSNTISATVKGPVTVSVADARAREGEDETIDFAVTLSRAASGRVSVSYATADGTARAGADYTRASGKLRFAPGETEKTISVPVLDDAHDEGEETLTLRLSKAFRARLADRVATGTIVNSDPLQRAWLARFGRTVATHVTDAVGDRLRGTPGQESHLTVGGYRLPVETLFGGADATAPAAADPEAFSLRQWLRGAGPGPAAGARAPAWLQGVAGVLGLGPPQRTGPWTEPPGGSSDPRLGQSRTLNLTLRQVLLGSSFRLTLGRDDVGSSRPRLTAWGRVAGTTFDGRDGNLTLDGDVLTGTVGVDGEWDRLLAGLAVAHSRGDGSFIKLETDDRGRGGVENTLTSLHPYLRYAVNDRLAVWGLFGYGWGELELEMDNGMTMETDTNLVMGAFGGRGILLSAAESGGFQLATRTDAMLTRTTSDKVAEMESAEADAHRLRLVLEGSRGFTWAEGRRLTPTMEVGLRHDWGDAETGFGLELGGRVQYADPALGLTIDAAVRGLLAHEDRDYEEWGASGSLRLAPGAGGQGLALTLSPAWGATASGVNGLWSRQTTTGLAPQGNRAAPVGRLNAEVGYGFAPFGTGLLTPYAGTVLSDGAARTYRVGGRLRLNGGWATGLALSLEGQRQEPAGQQPINQGLRFQLTWGF